MSERFHVCNVDEEGRFGGPERRIVLVAAAATREGVDTHVVYPTLDSEAFSRHLQSAGVPATALNITRLTKERRVLLRYALRFGIEILGLARFFRRHRFDIVHVNGSYQFKVAIAARLAGIPVVWHLNDTMMDAPVRRMFSLAARFCATGFIVAGRRVHDYYLSGTILENRPCLEIHAPVDTDLFQPGPQDRPAPAHPTVATVSGINPTKGVEYFVRMAGEVHSSFPEVRFAVAGAELESHAAYSAEIRQLVTMLGFDDGTLNFHGLVRDVPRFLQDADICVFTSISEASPASVWEAMAMGKPVITTDVGSVREYVQNGISGFVVPVRDVHALAERVTELLKDASLRQRMGRAAREVAVAQLSVESAARKHREIYSRIKALSREN